MVEITTANVKPIPFSGPMVRAMLDGRKTQTRRVMTPDLASFGSTSPKFWEHADFGRAFVDGQPEHGQYLRVPCHQDTKSGDCILCSEMGWGGTLHRLWPRRQPGDLLWVREAFHAYHWDRPRAVYRADYADKTCRVRTQIESYEVGKWSPSIHMPRWASRLTLEVTGVKVERLQEITSAGGIAEGMSPHANSQTIDCDTPDPRDDFRFLWDSLNAKRPGASWADNPWIAAITFRVHQMNVDAFLAQREAA